MNSPHERAPELAPAAKQAARLLWLGRNAGCYKNEGSNCRNWNRLAHKVTSILMVRPNLHRRS